MPKFFLQHSRSIRRDTPRAVPISVTLGGWFRPEQILEAGKDAAMPAVGFRFFID
jgi:hypothetical protein